MRRLLLALALIFFPLSAYAEDLYVGQAAAGGDTGANCANQHSASWFNAPGNWGVGAGKVSAGDSVHLCGTITSVLTAQASGTVGNIITIVWETGAKLSQAVCPLATGCFNTNSQTYLTLDGGTDGIIESTANGSGLANQLGSIGVLATACNNCTIKNLHINNIYIHNSLTDVTVTYSDVNAIRFSGSNVRITTNTIHDTGWAIYHAWAYAAADSTVEIDTNTIYNSSHGITSGGYLNSTLSTVSIHNNHVYDMDNWDTNAGVYHHDGLHMYGSSNAIASDVDVYDNLFDGDCGVSNTGMIFIEGQGPPNTDWQRIRVFNNIVICTINASNFLFSVNSTSSPEIYNNTIIGMASSVCVALNNLVGVKFKNNAISSCQTYVSLGYYGAVTITAWDYTAYGNIGSNPWAISPSSYGTIGTWRTGCSCDTHSTNNASLLLGSDGVPSSSSLTVDVGVDLTSLSITALNSDYLGNARGSGSGWDMGAFEFGATPPAPDTPTGLRVAGGNGSTFAVLIWSPCTDGCVGYWVYRSTTSGTYGAPLTTRTIAASATARSSSTRYIDTGLNAADTYYYKIAAIDGSGNLSALSSEVSITVTGLAARTAASTRSPQ